MEARFLVTVARRSLWWLLLGAVVGLAGGVAYGHFSPHSYESEAIVEVDVPYTSALLNTSGELPSTYVATQVGVMQSSTIAQLAARSVGRVSYRTIQKEVTVSEEGTSDLVTIVAKTSSPDRSAQVANAVASAYVSQHGRELAAPLLQETATLQSQLASIQAQIRTARNAGLAGALQTEYSQLTSTLSQVTLALKINATTVSTLALAAPEPAQPRHALEKGLIGLAAGVVLAYLVSILVGVSRPRFTTAVEIEDALGIGVAAELPRLDARSAARLGDEGSSVTPTRLVATWEREVSRVCALLEAAPAKGTTRRVLVVGSQPGAGSSALARQLAGRLGASQRVQFVASSVLDGAAGDAGSERAIAPMATRRGAGDAWERRPTLTYDFPGADSLDGRSVAGEGPDVVVFDGGALGATAHSVRLARSVDVVVVVVALPGKADRTLVQTLRASLAGSDAEVILVANHGAAPLDRTEAAATRGE